MLVSIVCSTGHHAQKIPFINVSQVRHKIDFTVSQEEFYLLDLCRKHLDLIIYWDNDPPPPPQSTPVTGEQRVVVEHFMQFSGKSWPINRLVPPLWGLCSPPLSEKSLIRHCTCITGEAYIEQVSGSMHNLDGVGSRYNNWLLCTNPYSW